MNYEQILYEKAGPVLTLTLNRPDKLNAYTAQMQTEMIHALDAADADDEIRAIIVTGAGRGYCAGADLSGGGNTFNNDAPGRTGGLRRDGGGVLTLRLFECLKPIISACNGPAVGVGATMQCAMDIRLASEDARYGFVFSKRAVVPEACSSWFLPKIVGIQQALEWTFSGRVFNAAEALQGGFVRSVHKANDLLPAAVDLAHEFAESTSPVSVALIRQMMWKMLGADHPMEAHKIDSRGIYYRGKSADAIEGVESFLEKRAPSFPGKVSTDMPEYFPWWQEREFK
ncbi:MAG: crotonase/enoyl-CoA hydratase family protein [Pseudomonadales bacterium]|jgi:enoyl-CoA hydratase/carnithine racemase|nr:crotonase/enoyl-CoA hydratase family protein [Pseudomonadales bacterium]MDA0761058.1 crotonase/enoyl-CoA hydratase family protein [Pseudomonadota bacterium]MDA0957780.1 crotonase/enoyl-CoA hydratase family protein [Pseudomonadota bacterium]